MSYDYVKRTYGVDPKVGQAVYHTVTKSYGIIKRENRSQAHYVMCVFEGQRHAIPCHPTELQYLDTQFASS